MPAMLVDWLLPDRCCACGGEPAPVCASCAATLVEVGTGCPRCAAPNDKGATCKRCRYEPLAVDRVVAPWKFGGQLASAIRRLKFAGATHIARTVAPLWAPVLAAAVVELDAIVVPVPLHWRRRFTRGFDHTWLLAHHACRAAELARPLPALRRTRHAPPQSTLPASERHANVSGAFVVRPKHATVVAGRAVVLVDDVVTTGATLSAAARALKRGGATIVVGVAIARAE